MCVKIVFLLLSLSVSITSRTDGMIEEESKRENKERKRGEDNNVDRGEKKEEGNYYSFFDRYKFSPNVSCCRCCCCCY